MKVLNFRVKNIGKVVIPVTTNTPYILSLGSQVNILLATPVGNIEMSFIFETEVKAREVITLISDYLAKLEDGFALQVPEASGYRL